MATINMHKAKSELSDLVARAEAGEEIVIARRNKPAVRLVPIESPDKNIPEAHAAGERGRLPDEVLDGQETNPRYQAGFAESDQPDLAGMTEAVRLGREFTIMQAGKPVATVTPIGGRKRVRGFGMLAHLPPVPDEFFFDSLAEDELRAWEGEDSFDPDEGKP